MQTVITDTIQRGSAICFPMLGDFTINPPAYFTIFGKTVYFYGIFVALGFILGIIFIARNSHKYGIKSDDIYDTVIWIIPFSIIGARLYFVLCRLDEYLAEPARIIAVWEGGLAIYGGVIAGIIVIAILCRKKKIPIPAMLDAVVCGLLIGQILGRWGNFMNREAFGGETDIFCRMGLIAADGSAIYVHPTFLYESLWNLACLISIVIWVNKGRRRYDGQAILIYFLWYGIGRAWIEGLRTESLYIGDTGIRTSQLLSVILVLASLAILLVQARRKHPPEKLYVNIVAARDKAAAEGESSETEEDKKTN